MPNPGKNGKNPNGKSQRQSVTSRQNATKTKAILKLKPARKPEQTNEVKELIYCFDDGDPKDNMILIITQQLWEDEDWKILNQIGGRALSG
jgi:hypothetical protein